jgi:hypothetical protein
MASAIQTSIHELVDFGIFVRQCAKKGITEDIVAFLQDHDLQAELASLITGLKALEAEATVLSHSPMTAFSLVGPVVSEISRLVAPLPATP